jgi:hypothetical protein
VVELPWAADCCPCEEKLRTVLPLTVGIRDGAVYLGLTLGGAYDQSSVASLRRHCLWLRGVQSSELSRTHLVTTPPSSHPS